MTERTEGLLTDWRAVPRSEMFNRVMLAVDASRSEAQADDQRQWVRYCDGVLFPFVEVEEEKARSEEAANRE